MISPKPFIFPYKNTAIVTIWLCLTATVLNARVLEIVDESEKLEALNLK